MMSWCYCSLKVFSLFLDVDNKMYFLPGQLWSWGPRVCCHPTCSDHHALRVRKTDPGQSIQGESRVLFYKFCLIFFFNLISLFYISLFLQERETLNTNIVHSINQASDDWGIRCLRYEIKDIHVPPRVKESMQMQVRGAGPAANKLRDRSWTSKLFLNMILSID